jgi:hypothetical protein
MLVASLPWKKTEPVPLLHKLFNFIPGQRLNLKFAYDEREQETIWEVNTTPLNEGYLECLTTGAKAYYQMDGCVFYFVHFEGNRKSSLYYFYLAFFQLPLFYGDHTDIQDVFPTNRVFSKLTLLFQDFLAPFALYLAGRYSLKLTEKQDLFGGDEINLISGIRKCIFDQNIQSWSFETRLSDRGFILTGNSGTSTIKIEWERKY